MIWCFWPTFVSSIGLAYKAMHCTAGYFRRKCPESGRPRMTEELQELGLSVGHGRVGRLMRENGIKVIRTQKYKATTDSNHTFNIAPNLLDQDFSATGLNQKFEVPLVS